MSMDYMLNPDKYHIPPPRFDGEKDEQYKLRLRAYSMGQKSQQAKIDEFKKLRSLDEMAINQLAQANQVWQIKCDELQARIDGALKSADINFWNSSTVKDMVDILKGNKDEN